MNIKYGQPVTDPGLISELENSENYGNNSVHKYGNPINDKNLINELEETAEKQSRKTIKKPTIQDNIKNLGLDIPNSDTERKIARTNTKDTLLGAAQSIANYPIEAVNLFKKDKLKEFNFAPKNKSSEVGGYAGDIASFFIPGGAAKGIIKGASMIPRVGELIGKIKNIPFINPLASVANSAGETALASAIQDPQDAGVAASRGGMLGGGTQAFTNLIAAKNPLIKLIGRTGAGLGTGYALGYPEAGALIGAGLPEVSKLFSTNQKAIDNKILEGLNKKDISLSKSANNFLGTNVTPAQASGNYVTAATEGNLKRTPQGAQLGYRMEELQKSQQQKSINRMLDKIHTNNPINNSEIKKAYDLAKTVNLNPEVIKQVKINPIMNDSFSYVRNLPSFEKIPENNYEYLSQVERTLSKKYKQYISQGDKNSAYAINETRKLFGNFLNESNPLYKEAKRLAQPRIVRENIERKMNKMPDDYTAKNFYNAFLNRRKSYNELMRETTNFPEAQQHIKNMRAAWKHLSNTKTVSQGEAQAKSGISQDRDHFKAILQAIKSLSSAKGDVKSIKYIYSPDWEKGFDRIMKEKEKSKRNKKLIDLFTKIAISYNVNTNNS